MEYADWVALVWAVNPDEPFCPFDGIEKTGYCDCRHPEDCYSCREAASAYLKNEDEIKRM